jgi:hypothetical protein
LIDFDHGRFNDPVAAMGVNNGSLFETADDQACRDILKYASYRHRTK